MSERAKALTRLIVILVLALNGLLAGIGVSPISNETAYGVVSDLVTILASVWAWWWKNNNMTTGAAEAQGFLNGLKNEDTIEEMTDGKGEE